jgi:PKD repeat protein
LGLKDINPNCIKYYNTIAGLATTINYVKGQTANVFWGNGDRGVVSNSGNYVKTGYAANGPVDIIIDLDKNAAVVLPLIADFSANIVEGPRPLNVQFSDLSTGGVEIWSWNFGDGTTSPLQNPSHVYTEPGVYTVTLQIFNSAKGHDTETKINYISVRNARILINNTDSLLKNSTERILKN